MSRRVDEFLAHYASKYYDPVKAKEYYERTKKLKGREPQLSAESRQRQSQATAYVSKEIATKRKADLDANAATRTKLTAAAKAQAEAHTARMEKLQTEATAKREKIVEQLKSHMEKLNDSLKIPANASPKRRAFLEKQRASQLNTAAGKAKEEMATLQAGLSNAINSAKRDYQKFREGNTAARRTNAQQRRTISDTYRKDLETEKKNIKEQVR